MSTVRVRKTFRNSSGIVSGLTPTLRKYVESTGVEVTPSSSMSEVGTTGVYVADVITTVPLVGILDGGSSLTDADDRYDSVLIHPDQDSRTILETPSGTYGITFQTLDEDDDPIAAVRLDILNGSGQVIRSGLLTDANGEKTITLEAGTYTAVPYKPMVNADPIAIVVAESTTIEIVCTAVSPSVPGTGNQVVWYLPADPSLVLDETSVVYAQTVVVNQFIDDAVLTAKRIEAVKVNGFFELSLAKGGAFDIVGTTAGKEFLRGRITVTDDNTRSLKLYGLTVEEA